MPILTVKTKVLVGKVMLLQSLTEYVVLPSFSFAGLRLQNASNGSHGFLTAFLKPIDKRPAVMG